MTYKYDNQKWENIFRYGERTLAYMDKVMEKAKRRRKRAEAKLPVSQFKYYYGHKRILKPFFLEIYKKIGVITPACKETGISKSTIHRWFREDEKFKEEFIKATEEAYKNLKELLDSLPPQKRHAYLDTVIAKFAKQSL